MKGFVMFALLVPAMALASENGSLDLRKIVSQQTQIRSDVLASRGYRGLSESTRTELLARQERLLRLIEGKQSAQDLDADQRMLAFNELEWIEGALNDEQDDRLVCKQEKKVGSNRPVRICRTAAQIQQEREAALEALGDQKVWGR